MGMELSLQAVPEAWRQRQNEMDPDIWDDVFRMGSWEECMAEEEEEFSPVVLALLSTDPGIVQHGFDLEKRWDLLAYMLSESRRSTDGEDFEPDPGWIAVRGEQQSAFASMQGMLMLYTPPSTIERVTAFLNGLADGDLRHAYDLAANDDQDLYRFDPAGACEEEREEMVSHFHGLRQFYRALPSDYAVLVRID